MDREPLTDEEIAAALALCESYADGHLQTPGGHIIDSEIRRSYDHRLFAHAASTGWPRALAGLKEARREVERARKAEYDANEASEESETKRSDAFSYARDMEARADRAEAALAIRNTERDDAREGWQDAITSTNEERDHSKAVEADRDEARRMYCELRVWHFEGRWSDDHEKPTVYDIADTCWPADADRLFPAGGGK